MVEAACCVAFMSTSEVTLVIDTEIARLMRLGTLAPNRASAEAAKGRARTKGILTRYADRAHC